MQCNDFKTSAIIKLLCCVRFFMIYVVQQTIYTSSKLDAHSRNIALRKIIRSTTHLDENSTTYKLKQRFAIKHMYKTRREKITFEQVLCSSKPEDETYALRYVSYYYKSKQTCCSLKVTPFGLTSDKTYVNLVKGNFSLFSVNMV